jgi:hypothetical protein
MLSAEPDDEGANEGRKVSRAGVSDVAAKEKDMSRPAGEDDTTEGCFGSSLLEACM